MLTDRAQGYSTWVTSIVICFVLRGPAVGQTPPVETNSIGQRLKFIPAGSFVMGGRQLGPGGFLKNHVQYDGTDERPRHPVRLTRPFYLATTEVTVAQFRQFVEETGHRTSAEVSGRGIVGFDPHEPEEDRRAKFAFRQKPEFTWKSTGFKQQDDHPVTGVSWQDAQAFCRWLSEKDNARYRLPTEAEWEYACRAGTDTYFSWGESYANIHQLANIGNVELEQAHPDRVFIQWLVRVGRDPADLHVYTAPVGRYPANPWGIHDMHGNVWEWCEDRYLDTAYADFESPGYQRPIPRAIDPFNDETFNSDGDWRVIRGGSWFNSPLHSRSAIRSYYEAGDAAAYVGFRVAREASAGEIRAAKAAFDAEERARSIVEQAIGRYESQTGTDLRARFNRPPAREVTRELPRIGGLTEIHINSQGRLDGDILADIAAVPELRILQLHHGGPNVEDDHFAPLARSTSLEKLQITAQHSITDGVLGHFAGLTRLRSLHLDGEQLTDAGLSRLRHLTNLRELDIRTTQSNGAVLAELRQAPLESIQVSRLTDATAEHLKNFPNLQRLSVYDSSMTDWGFSAIAGLHRLRSLRLRNCPNISPDAFTALAEMRSLTSLDVMETPLGDGTLALIANLALTSLELNSEHVTDIGMKHVCSMITLNRLVIGRKTRVTDRGLKHLWRLNRLSQFDLYSPLITGTGFGPLAELPKLHSLRLTSPVLTDEACVWLSETPSMNHLELGWAAPDNSSNLSDSALQSLAEKSNLRHIAINRRGTTMTDAGIEQLRAALRNTRIEVRD